MQIQFSARQAISDACTILNKNILAFLLTFVLYYVISTSISSLGTMNIPLEFETTDPLRIYEMMFSSEAFVGTMIIAQIVAILFNIGFAKMCLDAIDYNKAEMKSFCMLSGKTYVMAFLTQLLYSIIVSIGLFFCIVPGLFLAVRLIYAQYFVIDQDLDPIDAIKASWRVTEGNFWHLVVSIILIGLVVAAGYLLCCVGIIYTIPLGLIAMCVLYRTLSNGYVDYAEVI